MSLQVCAQLEGEALSDDEIDEMFRCADIACDLKDGHWSLNLNWIIDDF